MCQKGCTANVLLIADNQLICANAGDSRCVIGQGRKAKELSKDHVPGDNKEKQRIENAGYQIKKGRVGGILNLSRAIGDGSFKKNPDLALKD